MSSPSAVVCREIFDENSQPSAEEISDYAQQLGIDPESESHLLPLAKDGLMQALPAPWKAYYDEKLQTHYYYNEDTKKTQWEHPLDNVYKELVKKARDASVHDDTCASVQELLTSEEITNKNIERAETKIESDDDDLSTDSENHGSDLKENPMLVSRHLAPLGRPPLGPRLDKRFADLKLGQMKRTDGENMYKPLVRNISDRDILSRPVERPKLLFKQQSEIIDLKMHVLTSPEEENFSPLLTSAKIERGLSLQGKGNQFFKISKSDLPSPDTDKSLPLDSVTKSDPPKGILREKVSDIYQRKSDLLLGRPRLAASLDEDKKSVRFKLENVPEPTISPGSNSSSEQNDQNSIASAPPLAPSFPSPLIPSSPVLPHPKSSVPLNLSPITSSMPLNPNAIVLSPLVARPPLPPRPLDSPRDSKSVSGSDKDGFESDRGTSPRRRVVRPPAADYIKPDLFQKNFQKISDLVRPGDIETSSSLHLEEPIDKDKRPRSPMIPQQKNKISINLMESIESETSIDSPDKEFANLDLNDLDDSNDNDAKETVEENSEKNNSKTSVSTQNKSLAVADNVPQIKVPKLELLKPKMPNSDSEDSKRNEELKSSKSESLDIKPPLMRVSPTPSLGSDLRSPRYDFLKPWSSPLSTFKPLNKAVIAPLKSSDSASSLGKSIPTSPRLDGVILSQGKSSSDNVVVVYQFENVSQEDPYSKPIKSPLIPDMAKDMLERNKADERRRLDLALQKELESIRVEWCAKERKMRAELQTDLKEAEEKFQADKRMRLAELAERHKKEIEEALERAENEHRKTLESISKEMEDRKKRETETAEKTHADNMRRLEEEYLAKFATKRKQLEAENESALEDIQEELHETFQLERAKAIEDNRSTLQALRDEHASRLTELCADYRAEVERLRNQHACHLEELRARLANERAAPRHDERALADKYKCLKEKYARLKHDVKMSIERRNKRREMSMTTGSETEKSNSHKQQSLERCKELNETSVSVVIESEPKPRNNNQKYNDNETSHSESNAQKSYDNNNDDWKHKKEKTIPSTVPQQTAVTNKRPHRRTAVAFREPPSRVRERDRHRDKDGAITTDCQDSSDATTADEKPKEPVNGHGRRRCFTRLKSASTSRLNYSPKRGEGWSSPLESLRQQLRKLDDLEDQFPDLACQPAYSLRYPFAELGAVTRADTPELEFVRHRALVEREGMRRARAVLKRRRAALRETRASLSPHRAPSEEREATELEVALHRARALLGEKEIRLRHIERALKKLADSHPPPPPLIQEATTSEASSGSEAAVEHEATGAVLRSLRALHADVRDIWRALEVRPRTVSPETSSANAATTSHTRMTLSAPEPAMQDLSESSVAEKARGLRAWLQTAP